MYVSFPTYVAVPDVWHRDVDKAPWLMISSIPCPRHWEGSECDSFTKGSIVLI